MVEKENIGTELENNCAPTKKGSKIKIDSVKMKKGSFHKRTRGGRASKGMKPAAAWGITSMSTNTMECSTCNNNTADCATQDNQEKDKLLELQKQEVDTVDQEKLEENLQKPENAVTVRQNKKKTTNFINSIPRQPESFEKSCLCDHKHKSNCHKVAACNSFDDSGEEKNGKKFSLPKNILALKRIPYFNLDNSFFPKLSKVHRRRSIDISTVMFSKNLQRCANKIERRSWSFDTPVEEEKSLILFPEVQSPEVSGTEISNELKSSPPVQEANELEEPSSMFHFKPLTGVGAGKDQTELMVEDDPKFNNPNNFAANYP
uniref:Uncharacterized protein n=1 Tax=Ciona savignyi TaxID=51511 RepID=H2YDQ9_CIOSA